MKYFLVIALGIPTETSHGMYINMKLSLCNPKQTTDKFL